jgi:hypothetical protein
MHTPFPPEVGAYSPWGPIDGVAPLGPDAVDVTKASRGGIAASLTAMARIPAHLRTSAFTGGGWFKEDCDRCIPPPRALIGPI